MYVDFVETNTRLVFWVLEGSLLPLSPGQLPLDRTEMMSLWEDLPSDLVETILMLVPPSSKFKFRSVCKLWKRDLSSSYLWQLHSAPNVYNHPIPFQCPSICAFQFNSSLAMRNLQVRSPDCRESHVQTMDLSFLPSEILQSQNDISVQDGLILMKNCPMAKWGLERVIDIVVVNPFTRTWIQLPRYTLDPELGDWEKYCLKVEVDSASNSSFTVFILMRVSLIQGFRGNGLPARSKRCGLLTYFSKVNSWKFDIQLECTPTRHEIASTFWHTSMYMVSDDGSIMRGNMPAVLATVGNANYRVMCIEDDTGFIWNQVNAITDNDYGFVTYGSNVFFVRLEDSHCKVELSVYKLNQEGEWKLFSVMPEQYCESMLSGCKVRGVKLPGYARKVAVLAGLNILELRSVAIVGKHLCLTLVSCASRWIETTTDLLHVVALHMEEMEWHMVSKIAYTGSVSEDSDGKPVLLLLQPRLDFFVQSPPSAGMQP